MRRRNHRLDDEFSFSVASEKWGIEVIVGDGQKQIQQLGRIIAHLAV